jgi:hypothetical protein
VKLGRAPGNGNKQWLGHGRHGKAACGERSTRPRGWVHTGPRDVQVGPDRPLLPWRKWARTKQGFPALDGTWTVGWLTEVAGDG